MFAPEKVLILNINNELPCLTAIGRSFILDFKKRWWRQLYSTKLLPSMLIDRVPPLHTSSPVGIIRTGMFLVRMVKYNA